MTDPKKDDDFFPGFIEDEDQAKSAPKPPKSVPAAEEGAFNPFAEPVEVPSLVPDPQAPPPRPSGPAVSPTAGGPAKPSQAAGPMGPAAAGAAATSAAADSADSGFDPFADAEQDGEEADDGELKPGSRKDLWNCPHCGTGNRPNRDTCRSCGKSPDEAVIQPWFKQPKVLAVIGAALVVLVVVLMMASGPSFALGPAQMSAIDSDFRHDQSLSGELAVGDDALLLRGRFAAVGRVVSASRQDPTRLSLVLAFGDRAREPDQRLLDRGGDQVGTSNALGSITRLPFVRVQLVDDGRMVATLPQVGDVVSLTGSWGDWRDGEASSLADRQLTVRVTGFRAAAR